MSGLEVFGIVASGAGLLSLAIQLADSAIKLKRIYHAAQNAPSTISRLAFDLETMTLALRLLEQNRQEDNPADDLLARCMMACRQNTLVIGRLVDKLEMCITRHAKMGGKLYAAFKQCDVKDLLDNLEKAKSSLELVYTIYQAEEAKRRSRDFGDMMALQVTKLNDLQTQMLTDNAKFSSELALVTQGSSYSDKVAEYSGSSSTSADCTFGYNPALANNVSTPRISDEYNASNKRMDLLRRSSRAHHSHARYRAIFRLPTWVSRRIYDVSFSHFQSGWDTHLRAYNVIPSDSLVVRHLIHGNVAGLRRLFETGRATPLDVVANDFEWGITSTFGPWRSLLEIAAAGGHFDLCQYLLGQTTWPDHEAVLSKALGTFSDESAILCWARDDISEMFRLFMADPGFDADVKEGLRYGWLQRCVSTLALDAILRTQGIRLGSYTLQARFEIASRLSTTDTDTFLKYVGLAPTDRRLAALRNSRGVTVLHLVAEHLRQSPLQSQEWEDLAVSVLTNGANPCSLAEAGHEPWLISEHLLEENSKESSRPKSNPLESLSTPLLTYLSASSSNFYFNYAGSESLRTWTRLMQRAGIDLRKYGGEENEIWESFGIGNITNHTDSMASGEYTLRLSGLGYGATPQDWSVKIYRSMSIWTHSLHPPPGAFIEESYLPTKITWSPTTTEENEGPWTRELTNARTFNEISTEKPLYHMEPCFSELMDGYQDDSGVSVLMQNRASRCRSALPRSHSQPPSLSRKDATSHLLRRSSKHHSQSMYHRCPSTSSWIFGCDGNILSTMCGPHIGSHGEIAYMRSCINGDQPGPSALQQSEHWYHFNCLAEIVDCQDSAVLTGKSQQHKYDCPCPKGRTGIRVDKMNVPEDLRPYHPRRQYFEEHTDCTS